MVIFMSLFGWLFRWNMWIITKNGRLNVLGINMRCLFIHHIPLCYVLCFLWGTFVHFEWSKCLVYHTSLHMSIRRCSASWCIQNRLTGIFISLNNETSRKYHIPKKNVRIGLEFWCFNNSFVWWNYILKYVKVKIYPLIWICYDP